MAYENIILNIGQETTADLSASQYLAVITPDALAVAGAAANAFGILQNKPDGSASGAQITTATVMVAGISRAIASAAIVAGAKVGCAAAGELRTAVSGDHVIGIALEAAAAQGDIFAVLLATGGAPLP